jgi:hypothetical protein
MDDNDIEFRIMHKLAVEVINQWLGTTSGLDKKWLQWKKWLYTGLKPDNSVQQLKKIMQVNNIQEYIDTIDSYEPISDIFTFDSSDEGTAAYSYDLKKWRETRRCLVQRWRITSISPKHSM